MAITPDTKSWTWVLERACPECGFDASAFPREQVGAMLRDNAAEWVRVLSDSSRVRQRPADDVWSALEYGCHVRDVFRIFDERLRRILTEDGPLFANWDQDATAVTDRYGEQEPVLVAEQLADAAAQLADRFDHVEGEQWELAATRSDGAEFTTESFCRYLVHDPVHHLVDVARGFEKIG